MIKITKEITVPIIMNLNNIKLSQQMNLLLLVTQPNPQCSKYKNID